MSMPRRRVDISAATLQKRFELGFGSGTHENFKPWQNSENTPTVSHSGKGYMSPITQREMHSLSALEDGLIYGGFRIDEVSDGREDYLLSMALTQRICKLADLKHVRSSAKGKPLIPFTTDFLVTRRKPPYHIAFAAKQRKELCDSTAYKALFVQHVYWSLHTVPFYVVTDLELPDSTVRSLAFLAPNPFAAGEEFTAPLKETFRTLAAAADWSGDLISVVRNISEQMHITSKLGLVIFKRLAWEGTLACDLSREIGAATRHAVLLGSHQ